MIPSSFPILGQIFRMDASQRFIGLIFARPRLSLLITCQRLAPIDNRPSVREPRSMGLLVWVPRAMKASWASSNRLPVRSATSIYLYAIQNRIPFESVQKQLRQIHHSGSRKPHGRRGASQSADRLPREHHKRTWLRLLPYLQFCLVSRSLALPQSV